MGNFCKVMKIVTAILQEKESLLHKRILILSCMNVIKRLLCDIAEKENIISFSCSEFPVILEIAFFDTLFKNPYSSFWE